MAADSAAIMAAAVRAAVLAKAPRRTVSVVAAAVASAFSAQATKDAAKSMPAIQRIATAGEAMPADASPEELLAALRASRAAQRKRKKENRKAARAGHFSTTPGNVAKAATEDAARNKEATAADDAGNSDGGTLVPAASR